MLSELAIDSNLEKARALATEGLVHARSANDEGLIAMAVGVRATALLPGDQADDEFHEAAEALRNVGDRWHLAGLNIGGLLLVSGNIGLVRLFTGDDDGARIALEEQLRICRDHNLRSPADEGLAGLAAIAAHRQHFDRGARLLGAACAIGTIGHPDVTTRLEQRFFETARVRLGDRRWSEAMQAGRRLAFRDAIELALTAPETLDNRTAGPSSHASGRRA